MPAPDHNDGTRGVGMGNKGGFGKSGKGHEYSGTSKSGALAGRPQLNVDFDLDNLGWGDLAHAAVALGLGSSLPGIAIGLGASALGLSLDSLADFDFGSGKPGVVSGKGPGGSGTGGGPGGTASLANQNQGLSSLVPGSANVTTEPASAEALRTSADIQNYISDLQRIALGESDSQAALDRFGVAPEQAMFNYRESFPEFGDSMSNLPLAEIIKRFGNMSPNPEPFAEGGRVGENLDSRGDERVRPRPETSTDLARFTQMLRDLMMLSSGTDGRGSENPFGAPDKPEARRPVQEVIPGGLIPRQSQSRPPVSRMESSMPKDIIPYVPGPAIEVEALAPPITSSDRTYDVKVGQLADSEELTASPTDTPVELEQLSTGSDIYPDEARAMAEEAAELYDIAMPDVPSVSRMKMDEDIAEEIRRFEEMGSVPDRFYIDQYRRGSQDAQRIAYYVLRSQGLSPQDAKNRVDGMTPDELGQMGSMGFAGGGSVRARSRTRRTDGLPMVEGDHVVPAHAVKGNEGGLAGLTRKLMGNQNYDGMIRGPGGPRDDAIKTRVYAAGGGIAGKMDNLQNPFNSVPARVSDKEYVIPRQAITNLGMMNGAREGDANKAGQDIIYQLVENLKRKA